MLRLGWAQGGRAVGVLNIWIVWQRVLARVQHIRPVRAGGILRYAVSTYRGEPRRLIDGGWVGPGATVLELHFDNERMAELGAQGIGPLRMARVLRQELGEVAELVETGALGPIAALHAITVVTSAASIFGFEARELPRTLHLRLDRFFYAGLVLLYNPAGWRAVRRHADRWPGELWMSAGELRRRYGPPKSRFHVKSGL